MLKKFVLFTMLCLSLVLSLPQESEAKWVYCSSDTKYYEQVDDSRITIANNVMTFWDQVKFYDNGDVFVVKNQVDVNTYMYRRLYFIAYKADGTTITDKTSSKWEPIIPGSNFEYSATKAASIYCKKHNIKL